MRTPAAIRRGNDRACCGRAKRRARGRARPRFLVQVHCKKTFLLLLLLLNHAHHAVVFPSVLLSWPRSFVFRGNPTTTRCSRRSPTRAPERAETFRLRAISLCIITFAGQSTTQRTATTCVYVCISWASATTPHAARRRESPELRVKRCYHAYSTIRPFAAVHSILLSVVSIPFRSVLHTVSQTQTVWSLLFASTRRS